MRGRFQQFGTRLSGPLQRLIYSWRETAGAESAEFGGAEDITPAKVCLAELIAIHHDSPITVTPMANQLPGFKGLTWRTVDRNLTHTASDMLSSMIVGSLRTLTSDPLLTAAAAANDSHRVD